MWVDVLQPLCEDPLALAAEAATPDERRAAARLLAQVDTREVSPAIGALERLGAVPGADVELRLAVARATWRLAPAARPAELVPLAARLTADEDRRVRRLGLRILLDCPSIEADRVLDVLDVDAADPGAVLRVRLHLRSLRAVRPA